MEVHVLGCAGGSARGRHLTTYVIDGILAIDAGALTTQLEIEEQRALRAVLISHGHLDHIWSLPLFLANRFDRHTPTCPIYGSPETIETIEEHQLNDRVWPDFRRIVGATGPVLALHHLGAGKQVTLLDRYEVTTVAMDHIVPTQGHLIRAGGASVLIGADTHTGHDMAACVAQADDLRAIVIECSFPNFFKDLARSSKHLTPELLADSLRAIKRDVPIYITHMKAGYEAQLRKELAALGDPRLEVLESGQRIEIN